MDNKEMIFQFLAEPVPGYDERTKLMDDWKERCKNLGSDAPEIFLEVLKSGSELMHYAALIGLRLYGYEAYCDGYGRDTIYKIKFPQSDEWITIIQDDKPIPFEESEYISGEKPMK
jgi:hypothetical protein